MTDRLLGAVDDLVGQLETVTRAGQQHLMSKIVALLTSHPRAAAGPFIAARVEELRLETKKAAPDGGVFANRVRRLRAMLADR